MSTANQEKSFVAAIGKELPNTLLGTSLDWIRDNMDPSEVFDGDKIRNWVSNTCTPEEVFKKSELNAWALENGYTKEQKHSYTELT